MRIWGFVDCDWQQIFYTVENEYSVDPEVGSDSGDPSDQVRESVSDALSDKLYVSPALDTASWCNETGYQVYLYVHKVLVRLIKPYFNKINQFLFSSNILLD